jgi:4-hydroxy-3-polyprenylbenzoate decarboxylase
MSSLPETNHSWVEALESDPDIAAMVDRRWAEYGLADLKLGEVDLNLFGYDVR